MSTLWSISTIIPRCKINEHLTLISDSELRLKNLRNKTYSVSDIIDYNSKIISHLIFCTVSCSQNIVLRNDGSSTDWIGAILGPDASLEIQNFINSL